MPLISELEQRVRHRLAGLDAAGLRRHLRPPTGVDLSSNDYLGLSSHPKIRTAYKEAIDQWGAGSGASRLVCGTLQAHVELEERLAKLKNCEAALTFSSGYAAAVGTITALSGKSDILILDKLCHASLIDGARLSGADLRIFPHNDLERLSSHLQWAEEKIATDGRIIVISESVFSMDGALHRMRKRTLPSAHERKDSLFHRPQQT